GSAIPPAHPVGRLLVSASATARGVAGGNHWSSGEGLAARRWWGEFIFRGGPQDQADGLARQERGSRRQSTGPRSAPRAGFGRSGRSPLAPGDDVVAVPLRADGVGFHPTGGGEGPGRFAGRSGAAF